MNVVAIINLSLFLKIHANAAVVTFDLAAMEWESPPGTV